MKQVRNIVNGLLITSSLCAIPLALVAGWGVLAGLAICIGYLMPWYGGMGMRGAFKTGTGSQKLGGSVLGIAFLIAGTWLLTLNSFSAQSWLWGPGLFGWGFLTVMDSDT
jgi:hypothetical protein